MKPLKNLILAGMLALLLLLLTGCFVQPDPSLAPLTISDPSLPFGMVTALPTGTPTPEPTAAPSATPDPWTQNDASAWEDWSAGALPTTTPYVPPTAAPGQESWETSAEDYNAGYPVLRLGSIGEDVADLQAQLTLLRYYSGTIDGRYTQQTQEAVRAFQQKNGLEADGIAGRETQDLLYSTSGQASVIRADQEAETYYLLKSGTTGIEVRRLQARLMELGYYAGGVDGLYGKTTADAVKAFQRANGLSADGQAGVQTQKKLYSTAAKFAPSPVATADPEATRTLMLGMSGNDVYALQQRLIELRYLSGVADGVFGQETQEALARYQQANGLAADGVASAATLRKLEGSSKAAGSTPPPTGSALREGDTGEAVYLLQARLFELGYQPGRIDGRYGAETTEAVRAFQQMNGLAVDGVAGAATQRAMASAKAASPAGETPQEEVPAPAPADPKTLPTMRKGDRGAAVTTLQNQLIALGYLSSADGQFGSGTDRAVKLFQEANGVTADGVVGPGTLSLLFDGGAVPYADYFGGGRKGTSDASNPSPSDKPINTDQVIQWASEGEDVRAYQRRLEALGYLSAKAVTGTFNQQTVEATKAFQRDNGLKVDGAAGPDTLRAAFSTSAKTANGEEIGD